MKWFNRSENGRFSSLYSKALNGYQWCFERALWSVFAITAFVVYFNYLPAQPTPLTIIEVVHAEQVEHTTPILDKIAECESGNVHFDPKTGQVLTVGNNNKTVDIGRYQINEHYWGEKATSLGLDLFDEEDNKEMAEWILANYGTEPWVHSKGCWN